VSYNAIKCLLRQYSTVGSVALLVARWTNDLKVAGSRPTKVVCITVLTGNRLGGELSALMDSDLAWVNGKSGRQS